MKVEDISKYAAQDILPPGDMTVAERLLWYELRDIYHGFKTGTITKEEGQKRKSECLYEFDRNNRDAEMTSKFIKANAGMWMMIEEKAQQYRQDKTIANADAFLDAVYGVSFRDAYTAGNSNNSDSDSAPTAQTTKTDNVILERR